MPKPQSIQLGDTLDIPILYEDRAVLAIDKPAHWLLAPDDWDRTGRNLQLAITSSIKGREFWASSRNLKFLRFIHRLDAETTGVVLFSKSPGGVPVYSRLFENRNMEKRYLAVVAGQPAQDEWTCRKSLGPDSRQPGRVRTDPKGREAETRFVVLARGDTTSLIEAFPRTGRTHQIRVHLLDAGHPVLGDRLYGAAKSPEKKFPLALRSVELAYRDPFNKRPISIRANETEFRRAFGFPVQRLKSPRPDDNLKDK